MHVWKVYILYTNKNIYQKKSILWKMIDDKKVNKDQKNWKNPFAVAPAKMRFLKSKSGTFIYIVLWQEELLGVKTYWNVLKKLKKSHIPTFLDKWYWFKWFIIYKHSIRSLPSVSYDDCPLKVNRNTKDWKRWRNLQKFLKNMKIRKYV